MNYGHRSSGSQMTGIFTGAKQFQRQQPSARQTETETPYFTAGIGNLPADSSDFEPENNLDEENWQRSLEISVPADLPTPELLQEKSNIAPKSDPELGEIVPIPNSTPSFSSTQQNMDALNSRTSYNPINIRTSGDRLEKSTIPEVDNIINELDQTGNLNNFYDEIRGTDGRPGMMEINLDNSFNRKLGQDQTANIKNRGVA